MKTLSTPGATALKGQPLVSVIIPYYKQEKFIAETVRSVEEQSYSNVEIIVIDDGSPVPATSVLPTKENVQVFRMQNQGAAAARNTGFSKSIGEYLIFLDSDDLLARGAVEAHLDAFAAHPEAGLAFGAARVINELNQELSPARLCRPRRDYFLMLLEGNPIACPGAAMLRRDAFVEAGCFDETFYRTFPNAEDYHLYLRLARRYSLVRHASHVADYRFHTSSKSQNKAKVFNATIAALDQLAREQTLSPRERARLKYGKRKIAHMFRGRTKTVGQMVATLYFKLHSMCDVPLWSYLQREQI